MMYFSKFILASGALVSISMPAIAKNADDGTVVSGQKRDLQTIYVYYHDLNLSSANGVERLENRVRSAARTICFSSGLRPLKIMSLESQCFDQAIEAAEPQIADAVRKNGTALAAKRMGLSVKRRAG